MAEEPEKNSRVHGVSIEQYAAVQAALGEGIDRDAVLVQERVALDRWEAVDAAWSQRLAEDLEKNGALQAAFDGAFADAQSRYGRRVLPLDEDLAAWLGFVRRWSAAALPLTFLNERGIEPRDVIRLHRAWSQRLARDARLRHRAHELLQAEPAEVASLQLVPVSLAAPPAAPQPVVVRKDAVLVEPPLTSEATRAAPPLLARLPHEEGAEPSAQLKLVPARTPTVSTEPLPVAEPPPVPRAPLVPTFALPGPTGTGPVPPLPAGAVLPFVASAVSVADSIPRDPAPPRGNGTDTVLLFGPPPPAHLALGPLDPAAPKASVSATADAGEKTSRKGILSLEDYAALCAEVAVFPDRAERAFARRGLALPEKRASTDLRWQARLRRSSAEREEWGRLYAHYRALFLAEARWPQR